MMPLEDSPRLNIGARFKRLHGVDWDFPAAASQSPFSSIHWHPCRFPSQVPATLIGALTNPGETVLDPFVGSGTTAVEAQRLGRKCIAIDLNPVATIVVRAKTINKTAVAIRQTVNRLKLLSRQSVVKAPVPEGVQGRKWYTKRTLEALRRLHGVGLDDELRPLERVIFDAAFSAVLLPACRETRHWGYVCDNTEPKTDHEIDVFQSFEAVLDSIAEAYGNRDSYWQTGPGLPSSFRDVTVIQNDARAALSGLEKQSVDLVVTSPPYFGVTDYTKAQRLSLEWMDLPIEQLRSAEIGARSKRHRLSARAEYLEECMGVFAECRRVLRSDRACAVLLGQSSQRASIFDEFVEGMNNIGFRLSHVAERKISPQRRLTPSLLSESLLLFT